MNSKHSILIIALIALAFLSMPASATENLANGTSGNIAIDTCAPGVCYTTDGTQGNQMTDGLITAPTYEQPGFGWLAGRTSPTGYIAAIGIDSYGDLGEADRITGFGIYERATGAGSNTITLWGSNSSTADFQNLGTITFSTALTQWNTISITYPGYYRYYRISTGTAGLFTISEITITGSPAPNITSWTNSFTNNASLNIAPTPNQNVIFSVLSANQTIAGYNWTVNGVNQNNNFSSFVYSFSAASYVVNATVTNAANGTSNPVTWTINGAAQQAPTAPYTSGDSIFTTKPSFTNAEQTVVYGSFYPATTTKEDCLFFGFICTDTTINVESTTGYVFISTQGSTSPIKFTPFTVDQYNNYKLFYTLDIGSYTAQLFGFAPPGSTCTSGIVYDFGQNGPPLGCYYPHNITTFTVTNANTSQLYLHWNTKLSNSTAVYGDTFTLAFQPVTANDYIRIFDNTGANVETYNVNASTITQIPIFIPLYSVGTWNATIYNGSDITQNFSAFLNVVAPGAADLNNSFDITMFWGKGIGTTNVPQQLFWNTGTYVGSYNITIDISDGSVAQSRTTYVGVPGQSQQITYTPPSPGAYTARFINISGDVLQQADIFISNAPGTTPPGGVNPPTVTGPQAATDLGTNLTNFMALPAFWGLVMWVLIIFMVGTNPRAAPSTPLVAFIGANLEAVIGLWNPFTWYVIVITWVIAGIYFTWARKTVTGVQ